MPRPAKPDVEEWRPDLPPDEPVTLVGDGQDVFDELRAAGVETSYEAHPVREGTSDDARDKDLPIRATGRSTTRCVGKATTAAWSPPCASWPSVLVPRCGSAAARDGCRQPLHFQQRGRAGPALGAAREEPLRYRSETAAALSVLDPGSSRLPACTLALPGAARRFATTADGVPGQRPGMIREAGFRNIARLPTLPRKTAAL